MNFKRKRSLIILLIAIIQHTFYYNAHACARSDKIQSSDSIISVIEQIVESNFFLTTIPEENKTLLLSDLTLEYRITELNKKSIIELTYNVHVKDYIQKYISERPQNVAVLLSLSDFYFPLIEEKLNNYGLPDELKYLAVIESSLNPLACSKSGAIGLWQFLFDTGKIYGLEINSLVDNRYDPNKSTEAACKYLSHLYNSFKDWHLALAAYNGGPGTVRYAIKKAGGIKDYWSIRKYLPEQTQNYVPAFIAANYIMSHANDHHIYSNFSLMNYLCTDTVKINRDIHLTNISEVLGVPVSVIKFLNPVYKKNMIPGNRGTMNLIIPFDKKQDFFSNLEQIYIKERSYQDEIKKLERNLSKKGMQKLFHTVQKGEEINNIAKKYDCMIMEIVKWNHLIFKKVYIGQELTIWVEKKKKKNKT